jgi:hypothetical protein
MGPAALISRGHGRNVPAVALIVSTKPERLAQEWVYDLGLDGLCCAAAAEMLSTCGWPNAITTIGAKRHPGLLRQRRQTSNR